MRPHSTPRYTNARPKAVASTAPLRAAVALLGFAAAGCGSSPTEPEAAAPATWTVNVELPRIYVVGDCEDTPGNPGEFAWRAYLNVPVPLGDSDVVETSGFPAEGGALPYSEDASPIVLADTELSVTGVAPEDVGTVSLTFSVVEWDPSGQDSRMAFRQSAVIIPGPSTTPRLRAVDVGASFDCRLSFEFEATWTQS